MNIVIQTYYTPHLDPSTFDHRIDAIKNTVAATWTSILHDTIDASDVAVAYLGGKDYIDISIISKDYDSRFDLDGDTYRELEDALAVAIDSIFIEPVLYCEYCGGVMHKHEVFNLLEVGKESTDKYKTFCKTCRPIVHNEMIRLMASRDVANILESANIPKIEEETD